MESRSNSWATELGNSRYEVFPELQQAHFADWLDRIAGWLDDNHIDYLVINPNEIAPPPQKTQLATGRNLSLQRIDCPNTGANDLHVFRITRTIQLDGS